jgi:hypothetical protein
MKAKILVVVMFLGLALGAVYANPTPSVDVEYVKISKQEFQALKKQALISTSILQRIRDLEVLYKQVKEFIDSFSSTIKLVKQILNIGDDAIEEDNLDFEHISGVILSPGFVEFQAETFDKKSSFESLGIESLEMDVFYNKNLFAIDHIEGEQVFGKDFKRISLPQASLSAKDRIEVPLSDVLASQVQFKIYFAPLNPLTTKVGDKTLVDVRYYKRPVTDIDGVKMPALSYTRLANSANYVQIKVK